MRRTGYQFTATRPDGARVPVKVLAYSYPGALDLLARSGWTNPERLADGHAGAPRGGGWRLDHKAFREACDFLGLVKPIQVKQTGRAGGARGRHQLRGVTAGDRFLRGLLSEFEIAADVGHYITMKSWLDPAQASRTLWHELCHAMQSEQAIAALPVGASPRECYDAWTTCEERGRGVAYLAKPIEVEAREYEAFAAEMPLVSAR